MVIKLPNGIYSAIKLSRNGLSRVFGEIKELSADPDYVAISYSPEITSNSVLEKVKQFEGKVIILQRMDFYVSDDLLVALQDLNAIVILDFFNVAQYTLPHMRDLQLVMTDDGLTLTVD